MNIEQETIIKRLTELIQPLLRNKQVQMVELTYSQQSGRALVRCFVDTARGVTIDELTALNQAIGALIEEHDVIPSAYMLEVSSPGLDRPLKTPLDFERVIGRRLTINTTVPINSRREYSGQLLGVNDEMVQLRLNDGEKLQILLSDIARAIQEIQW